MLSFLNYRFGHRLLSYARAGSRLVITRRLSIHVSSLDPPPHGRHKAARLPPRYVKSAKQCAGSLS